MNHRLRLLVPALTGAAVLSIGVAAAASALGADTSPSPEPSTAGTGRTAASGPAFPSVGDPSPVGWGSTYQAPLPGSGIDVTKDIPGLNVPYGAATGGLFASVPDPASGYVQTSASNHPPAVGEIDSFLANDGHEYYRVVNRGPHGTTYSH